MRAANQVELERNLSLPLVVLYGLGTTVGAGIYTLPWVVSADARMYAALAFLVTSLLAAATALSFAELCARFDGQLHRVLVVVGDIQGIVTAFDLLKLV